ncbi:optic atrophy 3 protein-domain-containing protein [Dunaliella salina]|uniref:Optic atrophy 3 protein-domain-containing protein n=1 Tax=Dunaliella salina TaxID=3046 RepID=A0ABQ7GT25_DUNSA|nr:optic atrophy 3 protein-domain-containing protein [Dunaliella salina]|eukprot:KAF5837760.1 optic atrophy 3 protein-domain-containing protein [Dunaliella salina]
MAAILAKIGALALKTAAKPLSSRFQAYVMEHPVARQKAVKAAQWMHRMEVAITRGAEGRAGKAFVGTMNEEKSLELASKIAGEGFVFMVGTVIVVFEYQRAVAKDTAKKRQEHAEKQALLDAARKEREALQSENAEQTQLIQRLMHRVGKLEDIIDELEDMRKQHHQKQSRKGLFGGFFGAKAPGVG